MPRAIWNGTILAESEVTQQLEGNHYFPPDAVRSEHLKPSSHTSVCSWKGIASYFHVEVGGRRNENAAWTYRDPKPEAAAIQDWIAFWRGVRVED